MKNILIIITVILIVAIGVVVFWYVFLNGTPEGGVGEDARSSFPFGLFGLGGEETEDTATDGSTISDGPETNQDFESPLSPLRQLAVGPVAGFIAGETFVRYIERATGHINDVSLENGTSERISNTTVPKIQKVVWANVDNLFIQYLSDDDTIETFAARIVGPEGTETEEIESIGAINGSFLSKDILHITTNTSGSKSFLLEKNGTGGIGLVGDVSGVKTTTLFSSELYEWVVDWPGNGNLLATTKPSSGISGYALIVNSGSGVFTKVLDGIVGLSTLGSPSLSKIVYGSGTNLSVYSDGESISIPVRTLPEKCVWTNDEVFVYCAVPSSVGGSLPDLWYQGAVSFEDSLYKIDTTNGVVTPLMNSSNFGEHFDMVSLQLTDDETQLLFINKKDMSLWSFQLVEFTETEPAE